ncbi:MAG TPA: proton-conducting transporter membrane subunit, partial [Candidatus Synoicihabitans sp.]|nr:proton-conducting transporter membrane subunit [Candidatus Synoicihabitans sp.]
MPALHLYESWVPPAAVLVSLVAVVLILASGKWPNLREAWTLLAAGLKFVLVVSLVPGVLAGHVATFAFVEIVPGVALALKADALGVLFALVASGLWIVTSVYSMGYMRGNGEKEQTRYFASFALSLSATLGIAFAANLVTFLIFYELLTLATYPLVVHKGTAEAIRAGRMYLAYALTAGLVFLVASGWIYLTTGNLDFQPGGMLPDGVISPNGLRALFVLFLVGVGVKSGLMP